MHFGSSWSGCLASQQILLNTWFISRSPYLLDTVIPVLKVSFLGLSYDDQTGGHLNIWETIVLLVSIWNGGVFTVHTVAKTATCFMLDPVIMKGDTSIGLFLHTDLLVVDTVEPIEKRISSAFTMWPDDEMVIHIFEPPYKCQPW